MSPITVYRARRIVTMAAHQPVATHVAVREGRVLCVGDAEDMASFKDATYDDRFAECVLVPGFVEGHAHAHEGALWSRPYVGYFDRISPDGERVRGCASIDAVVARLKQIADATPDATPIFAWGFDPIYFGGRRMDARDLDNVSATRPVLVIHASLHIVNVNTFALARAGFDETTNVAGLPKGADGKLTGEIQGPAPRAVLFRALGLAGIAGSPQLEDYRRYARAANVAGVTTITDLHSDLSEATLAALRGLAADESAPLRIAPAYGAAGAPAEEGAARLAALKKQSGDRLFFGIAKFVIDGSIQGFTARLKWPHYHNGAPNGLWYVAPDDFPRVFEIYHRAGVQVHVHTNGDEATDVALDAIERALINAPRPDHRHTLQHCQLASEAQYRRMKALGVCVNLFSNHLWHWGEAHVRETIGPERAARMNAAATAERLGVPFAIHSDAPVTPLAPLFTAWCAVNRFTHKGQLLGPHERISVESALRAVTLGAAFTLKLDHLVGSIEIGKFADFAVLDEDPLAQAPERLKDIKVIGTMVGGRWHEAPHVGRQESDET